MGELIQFPGELCSRGRAQRDARGHRDFGVNATPEEVLAEYLREAREDQFVFLAIAVYRKDGSYAHVELGLADDDQGPEPESPLEPA